MAASIRTINVGQRSYLQAVEYVNEDGKRSMKILKSFGQDNLENRLQAEQFASNYNTLRVVAKREAQQPNVDIENLLKGALVIFGLILGTKIIHDIFEELSKP